MNAVSPSYLRPGGTVLESGSADAKKGAVVLLRWVLIIACSCLILFQREPVGDQLKTHFVVLFLIFSNLVLAFAPARLFLAAYFDHFLVTFDILFVSSSIWLSGQLDNDLYLLYFLVIMIAAVGETLKAIMWSAALVSLVYLSVMTVLGGSAVFLQPGTLIRVPFFIVVALFYGYFAQLVRAERRKKAEYERELSAAKQLREMSILLAQSFDRRQILETLVRSALELCRAEFCAVLSRGSQAFIAEAGNNSVSSPQKMCALLLTDLERRIAAENPAAGQEPLVLPEYHEPLEFVSDSGRRICFVNDSLTFLPVNGQLDSDLYLCMVGRFSSDLLDYAALLLANASLALHNSGQYQALVHEAEKRQQMVRQLTSALRFKSEFAANISHEIRTPIYAFSGFAELLLNKGYGELNAEQERIVQRMLSRAQRLLELVNDILDHSKLEAGEWKVRKSTGSLSEFLQEIGDSCEALLKDNPVSLHVSCAPNLPPLTADWVILRQITVNLVSNAVKFTPKGRVDLSAKADLDRGRLTIEVADTGIGMSPESMNEIFEPFRQLENSYTKKYAGTGLGLAITKRQVKTLGGEILVESKLGRGSVFTVHIPIDPTESSSSAHPGQQR